MLRGMRSNFRSCGSFDRQNVQATVTVRDLSPATRSAKSCAAPIGASLLRTESRLSHFREDHPQRDDANWLVWIDVLPGGNQPEFIKTPVPTPLCPVLTRPVRPTRLNQRLAVAGN